MSGNDIIGRASCVIAGIAMMIVAALWSGAAAAQQILTVPATTIYPGDTISDGVLVDRSFTGTAAQVQSYKTKREELLGKVARRTLLAGYLIPADALREPFAVIQGQAVAIVFTSGGLSITGQGTPLKSAAIGDEVDVRNSESGIVVKGRVMPDHTVAVDGR